MTNPKNIYKVWTDTSYIYAETADGQIAKYAFADWRTLSNATEQQRKNYYLSYSGIHWDELDEDLSFNGLFHDNGYDFDVVYTPDFRDFRE
ncbi:MAG: DUF2442 domain-containing protein [Bacteroidales bacterium]|nr:DUF2442 domain-containing protein [Bacteroidales bacterium]